MSKIIETLYPSFFKLCPEWTEFFYTNEMEEIIMKILNDLPPKFYPSDDNIFRCFYMTPLKSVKVVIVGQDPYHNGSATGLCFEVSEGNLLNPSVQNIYKELEQEGFYPTRDGCLSKWAKQGILLLNIALTVEPHDPESHLEMWWNFFEKVLGELAKQPNIVWLILGQKAKQAIKGFIPKTHSLVEATHPSLLGANKDQKAFMGSGVFKKVNQELKKFKKDKIVW